MLGETVGVIDITTASTSGYLVSHINKTTGATKFPPTRIFHIHLISSSTASNLQIANGQGGTVRINVTGTLSKGIDFDFGIWGITFPLGAYFTTDANITEAAVICKADDF